MDASIARQFYPGSTFTKSPDIDFVTASNDGGTPISEMVIFGHADGDTMWGGGRAWEFTPKTYDPEEPKQNYAQAEIGLFPRRCWFTRNATTRSVGCNSDAWGADFASKYLRVGATVITTTRSVRPSCSAPLFVGGVCTSYDGLNFAASSSRFAATLDGPFWSTADFHGSKFWKTIKGKL